MAKDFARRFYHSQSWVRTRNAYFHSVGGLCERCRDRGLITPGEIVHHKIVLTPENINNKAVALSWDNLEVLCRKCHGEVHEEEYRNRPTKRKRRFLIGEDGSVSALPDPPMC